MDNHEEEVFDLPVEGVDRQAFEAMRRSFLKMYFYGLRYGKTTMFQHQEDLIRRLRDMTKHHMIVSPPAYDQFSSASASPRRSGLSHNFDAMVRDSAIQSAVADRWHMVFTLDDAFTIPEWPKKRVVKEKKKPSYTQMNSRDFDTRRSKRARRFK